MRIYQNDFETRILGETIFIIEELSCPDDLEIAYRTIEANRPCYSLLKLDQAQLPLVHHAEELGFRFLELQFETVLTLSRAQVPRASEFTYERIDTEDQFENVAQIARNAISQDRVSRDPLLGPELSGERYVAFLRNSFESADEEVWSLRRRSTGEYVSFRSHRRVNDSEVRLLVGGIRTDLQNLGLGQLSSDHCFFSLRQQGYRRARTSISATNVPIVNLELGHLGFRVRRATFILRKVLS